MASQWELFSVVAALQFVVVAAVLFVVAPGEAVIPVVPLFLIFLFGLYKYRS